MITLDPFSCMFRQFNFPSPDNILLLAIKYLMCYYFSHFGWFGLVSVVLTIIIQLHYGFFVINKDLQLVKELSLNLIEGKNKKKMIVINSQTQLGIVRKVLYAIKLVRLILPLVDEAFYLILPFLLLFGEVIFVSCIAITQQLKCMILFQCHFS